MNAVALLALAFAVIIAGGISATFLYDLWERSRR